MALDSEAIWDALTERLRARLTDVRDVTRRPKVQYVTEELPVCIVRDDEGIEENIADADDPSPVWRLTGEVQIHARTLETDTSPTTQLNALVQATRAALEFDAASDPYNGKVTHYTNLGGLLRVLSIEKVEKGAGALTGLPAAVLTVTMEALG